MGNEDVAALGEGVLILGEEGNDEIDPKAVGFGSTIYANKPGDGSAREQAASCQRVVGAWAEVLLEKRRYRLIPVVIDEAAGGDDLLLIVRRGKRSLLVAKDGCQDFRDTP